MPLPRPHVCAVTSDVVRKRVLHPSRRTHSSPSPSTSSKNVRRPFPNGAKEDGHKDPSLRIPPHPASPERERGNSESIRQNSVFRISLLLPLRPLLIPQPAGDHKHLDREGHIHHDLVVALDLPGQLRRRHAPHFQSPLMLRLQFQLAFILGVHVHPFPFALFAAA